MNLDDGGPLPDELVKLRQAKEELVRDQGVGTDVPTCATFERNDVRLGALIAQGLCKYHWSQVVCATIMATGATGIVMAGETYLGPCESAADSTGLDKRFAEGDRSVAEAVFITVANAKSLR